MDKNQMIRDNLFSLAATTSTEKDVSQDEDTHAATASAVSIADDRVDVTAKQDDVIVKDDVVAKSVDDIVASSVIGDDVNA